MNYELVCGLETHIELSSKTKIFCGCTTAFGGEANTHCCPICIGLPGTLPSLNEEVVNLAIKAGLAVNCKINMVSKMDRKNYVYPDLPKAYQISQFELPICKDGYLTLKSGKKIRINRIHIEEDAGKLIHKGGETFIDYNRGGVPLIEIVTEPDISSSDEAREYLEKLQLIMKYCGVSDCKMQEGSIRCDVNISIRPEGSKDFGVRTEIKNMNSLSFMVKAIEFEKKRQIELLNSGEKVTQETLRYIESTGETQSMRDKEDANDYRYFREPDLLPINITSEKIDLIKSSMPELPDSRIKRYVEKHEIPEKDAILIAKYKNISDFFDVIINDLKNAKIASNFLLGIIFSKLETEEDKEKFDVNLSANDVNELSKLVESKKINMNFAKSALNKMLQTGKKLNEVILPEDMQNISREEIEKVCIDVIKENLNAVEDYKNGKEKALKSLIGQVMKTTKGKADPKLVDSLLVEFISNHTK